MGRRLLLLVALGLCLHLPELARAQQLNQIRKGWRSPAGLIYRKPSKILEHGQDRSDLRVHGVFRGNAIQLIDEAWRLAQAGGPGVIRVPNGRRDVIEVDMGRPVGFLGGQIGANLGNPAINHLRLIVEGNKLVTAYPDRPESTRPQRPWHSSTTPPTYHNAKRPPPENIVRLLAQRGIGAAQAQHVALGLPSNADTNPNDYLLQRERYVVSYNRDRKNMNWASWHLSREDFGNVGRQKDFREDPDLPASWGWRPDDSDYSGSGWTRGHMVPSGETTADRALNSSTYLMSNISPQAQSVNNGPWNRMENYYRDLVRFEGKEVYVIAGNIFRGQVQTIGRGIHVPTANFKVMVVLDRGQTLADVNANTRVIAAIVPNHSGISEKARWSSFRTTVSAIERQTGLSFFSNLPPQVAEALRNKMDRESIPDGDHPLWLQMQQQEAAAAAAN